MQDIILLKQGEIVLKGLNKKYFEQKLISNVKRRLRSLGEFDVTCTQSTIYVEPKSDYIDTDETQQATTKVFRIAAVVLVGLLTFIAFIFINNTIRLSITARRREIAIMRLVGASNGFIRGPFITEGVLQAILGSLLSIGVLELLRNLMIPRLQESIGWMSFALPMQYYLVTYAALILVGVIIGLFGSAIAMRRYLRVEACLEFIPSNGSSLMGRPVF